MSKLPLSRFKVIDLTRVRAGPTAVRQLADWGADVIKIEIAPRAMAGLGGARHGPDFQNLHRNKRSLTLNLKSPEGLEIFCKLVEGRRRRGRELPPGREVSASASTTRRLKKINPRLVYGSISGFGQDGPYRDRPGFDQIAQGMGGLMSITGLPGQGPVRVGIPVADLTAGIFCAMGILMALLEREESGEGQWVQSSLLDAQISMLDFQAARWLIARRCRVRPATTIRPASRPASSRPRTAISTSPPPATRSSARFCKALGATASAATDPDYATDKGRARRTATRSTRRSRRSPRRKTSADWIELLNKAGVPCGPIYAMDEVFADPQVQHLGIAQPVDHPTLGRSSWSARRSTLSRTPSRLHSADARARRAHRRGAARTRL